MLDAYEFFQGVVFRQLVTASDKPLTFEVHDFSGRTNSYCVNSSVGIYIKHSSKRLSPWQFSFPPDQRTEFRMLGDHFENTFGIFVCGHDGIVAVPTAGLRTLIGHNETDQGWIRVSRSRNSMYALVGSSDALPSKIANGVSSILEAIG
jgi:hypothetical protein